MSRSAEIACGCAKKGSLVLSFGLFLFVLYTYFPCLFELSVASSPILFCTALLLGALLSLGEQTTFAKKEQKQSLLTSSMAQKVTDELSMKKEIRERDFTSFDKQEPEKSDEKGLDGERREIVVESREILGSNTTDSHEEAVMGPQHVGNHNEACSSASDDESSSLGASVSEVIPVLDELRPLIDSDSTGLPLGPTDESDTHEPDDGDLVEEAENADEEESQEKAVVIWTDDDEKNLKNLGNLEIERNQRLETPIAKRRARKRWMVEPERNLIDFDNNDGFHMTINTQRNPFDSPYDFDEIKGLPHIPGSAPSVLLPRLNPFDIPFDQSDDRADLVEQQYPLYPQRDFVLRRYESFAMGDTYPSDIIRHEKNDNRLRPYFTVEGSDLEVNSIPIPGDGAFPAASATGHQLNSIAESTADAVERHSDSSEEADTEKTDSYPSDIPEERHEVGLAYEEMKSETSTKEKEGTEGLAIEPIYDLSPSGKNKKSIPTTNCIPEAVFDEPRVAAGGGIEPELQNVSERAVKGSNDDILVAPLKLLAVDELELKSEGVLKEVGEGQVMEVGPVPEVVEGVANDKILPIPMAKVKESVTHEKVNQSLQDTHNLSPTISSHWSSN